MFDLDSQIVRDLFSNLLTRFLTVAWLIWTLSECVICSQIYTDPISDGDMVDLDSQDVRDWLLNQLTWFLTVAWLIWTLRLCVKRSQVY